MFGAVVITFAITSLTMVVLFQCYNMRKRVSDNSRLKKTNKHLINQITTMRHQDNCRQKRLAYNKGLYDARETDTLYRKMLDRYSAGDQATVMMYGDEDYKAQ